MDCDDLVVIVFIDLSKAFDFIDHGLLLAKLTGYGFDDISLQWFTDYLSCHQQCMVLDHTFSDWATVVRGVPQRSVLGPLLFSIYMNDLPGTMNFSQIALFADDIAMYFSNGDAVFVQTNINSDLALLSHWAADNGFRINVSKFQSMVLARRHRRSQVASIIFQLNDEPLPLQKCIKYLGVLVDQDLTWSQQVGHVRRKSLAAWATIRRVSTYIGTSVLIALYSFATFYLLLCSMALLHHNYV